MRRRNKKYLIILLSIVLTIVIAISIVLPITLSNSKIDEPPVDVDTNLNEITEMNIELSLTNETMVISLITTQKDDYPLFSFTINDETFHTSLDNVKSVALDDETYLYSMETNELDFDVERFVLTEAKWSKFDTTEGSYSKSYEISREIGENMYFKFNGFVGFKNDYYSFENTKEFALSFYNPLNFTIEIEKEGSESVIYDRQVKVGNETYVYYKINDSKENADLTAEFKNAKYYKKENEIHTFEFLEKINTKYYVVDSSFTFDLEASNGFYISTKDYKSLEFADITKPTFVYYYLNENKEEAIKSPVILNSFEMDLTDAVFGKNTITFVALEYQGEEYLKIEEQKYEFEAKYLPIELEFSKIVSESNLYSLPATVYFLNQREYSIDELKIGTEDDFLVYNKKNFVIEKDKLKFDIVPQNDFIYLLEVTYTINGTQITEKEIDTRIDTSSLKYTPLSECIETKKIYVGDFLSFQIKYSDVIKKEYIKTIKVAGKIYTEFEQDDNSIVVTTDIVFAGPGVNLYTVEITYITETKEELNFSVEINPVIKITDLMFIQTESYIYKLELTVEARTNVELKKIQYEASFLVNGQEVHLDREPVIIQEEDKIFAYITILENYPNYTEGILHGKFLIYSIDDVDYKIELPDNILFVENNNFTQSENNE